MPNEACSGLLGVFTFVLVIFGVLLEQSVWARPAHLLLCGHLVERIGEEVQNLNRLCHLMKVWLVAHARYDLEPAGATADPEGCGTIVVLAEGEALDGRDPDVDWDTVAIDHCGARSLASLLACIELSVTYNGTSPPCPSPLCGQ